MTKKLLITGATGFIGKEVVELAIEQGFDIAVLARNSDQFITLPVEIINFDLSGDSELDLTLYNIDAVVHLAGSMTGNYHEKYSSFISGTERLLAAMQHAGIKALIGISSISVLDYVNVPSNSIVDEGNKKIDENSGVSDYAKIKKLQEDMFVDFFLNTDSNGFILRPGLVYSENILPDAHAGIIKGKVALLSSHNGKVPLVHVDNLADLILELVKTEINSYKIFQVVDDNLPAQKAYINRLDEKGIFSGKLKIIINWRFLSSIVTLVDMLFNLFSYGNKLPEALTKYGFSSRLKPFEYSNAKVKSYSDWRPKIQFTHTDN